MRSTMCNIELPWRCGLNASNILPVLANVAGKGRLGQPLTCLGQLPHGALISRSQTSASGSLGVARRSSQVTWIVPAVSK
jgi:hypothetical protein